MSSFSLPILGPLAWIDVVLLGWFVLTALSVAYVAYDIFRYTPEMKVMRWGWVLVTLYTGILGAGLFVLSCKEPRPGAHEEFIRPLWKQSVGSTIHCVAGDATGIVVAATITGIIGFPMWVDLISEYTFGFLFGLLVFQALFMKDMLGGSYTKALKHSFLPEWLSMNMVMAGMIPVMTLGMMGRDMRAMEPSELRFWGVMSLGVIVGFITAFPVNVWLVWANLKHGMGTERALGKGGSSVEAERERLASAAGAQSGHAGHSMPAGAAASPSGMGGMS